MQILKWIPKPKFCVIKHIYQENEEESANETEKALSEKQEENEERVMFWKPSKGLVNCAGCGDRGPRKANTSKRKYAIGSNAADRLS